MIVATESAVIWSARNFQDIVRLMKLRVDDISFTCALKDTADIFFFLGHKVGNIKEDVLPVYLTTPGSPITGDTIELAPFAERDFFIKVEQMTNPDNCGKFFYTVLFPYSGKPGIYRWSRISL